MDDLALKVAMHKANFEIWALTEFGEDIKKELDLFSVENGFESEVLNAMWIGFVGGHQTASAFSRAHKSLKEDIEKSEGHKRKVKDNPWGGLR